ncbi:hypothetical protein ACFO0N_11870 [Halobium salinum]|uniref:Secreted protein n=1 Tax=Halobium salinum TaxID=1364940 RepID=A0ABD5PD59_9EURY|nr:hypothetical protein [Halobium salinum]
MSPTRRGIIELGAVLTVGALAGCLGDGGTGDPGTDDGEDGTDGNGSNGDGLPGGNGTGGNASGETRPAGTGGPGVIVVGTDEAPDLPVRPAVEVVREAATDDHPPQLRVTVENTSPETVRVGEGRAVVFSYVTDDSGYLTLLPTGEEYPAEAGCWKLTEGIAVTEEYRTVEIAAGESLTQLVDLYATQQADGCLPVGEFRFETTYSVLDENAEPVENGQAAWGFSVTLE